MIEPDIAAILAPATSRPLPPLRFGVDDVIARGSTIRRRRRRSLAAGCAAVAVAVGLLTWRPGVTSDRALPLGTGESQRGGRARTRVPARTGPLPAGAVASRPVAGVHPSDPTPLGHVAHAVRWFSAPGTPDSAEQWILGHAWGGSFTAGAGTTSHGWQVRFSTGGQLGDRADPWPIVGFTLQSHGRDTVIRVDGWLAPRAEVPRTADTMLAADAAQVVVTEGSYTDGGPHTSTLSLDLTGPRVGALVAALNALPGSAPDPGCTADHPTQLAFRSGGHAVVFSYLAFCGSLAVTVDGHSRPPLAAFDVTIQEAIAALAPPNPAGS